MYLPMTGAILPLPSGWHKDAPGEMRWEGQRHLDGMCLVGKSWFRISLVHVLVTGMNLALSNFVFTKLPSFLPPPCQAHDQWLTEWSQSELLKLYGVLLVVS